MSGYCETRDMLDTAGARAPAAAPSDFAIRAWLVIALAVVVRFIYIDRFEVWLDEAYCFELASKPVAGIIAALRRGNEPPLHLLMLHFWMKAFGESAFAMRSLSAIASAATAALVVFWRTPWLPRRARFFAGSFLAITPISLYYAQQVRMYSVLVLIVVASMVFLERYLRLGRIRDWACLAVLTTLGLYTSYVAIYLVPAGYMAAAAMRFSREYRNTAISRALGLGLAHATAALLFVPWLPMFIAQPSASAVAWIRPIWQRAEKPLVPLESLSVMTTGGAWYPAYLGYLYQGPDRQASVRMAIAEGRETNRLLALANRLPSQAALAACVLVACAAVGASLRSGVPRPWAVLLWSWLILSFAVPFALSFFWPVFVPGRYELPGVPAFALLCGIGAARLPPYARQTLAALAAVLFAYTWVYMFNWPTFGSTPFRGKVLAETARPGDVVVCESFEYSPIYYAVGPARNALTFLTVPGDMIQHSGWMDFERWFPGQSFDDPPPELDQDAEAVIARAVQATRPAQSLIVVRPVQPTRFDTSIADRVDAAIDAWVRAAELVRRPERSREDCGIIVYDKSA